jgi:hypothetical protein
MSPAIAEMEIFTNTLEAFADPENITGECSTDSEHVVIKIVVIF